MGGEHTHGKGTVQAIIDLNNFFTHHGQDTGLELKKDGSLGALRLTTQKFYRITGESTQYRGVTPDIVLPDQFQGLKSGEQFLDFALPWDIIKPVPFDKATAYRMDLPELKANSRQRVSVKQEFIDISEKSREMTERQKKTLRPLHIDEAARERKTLAALKAGHDAKKSAGKKEAEKDRDAADLSVEKRRQVWLKETAEDPYVQEAISVLTDVASHNAGLSFNDAPAASLSTGSAH
jgi:carboxyl-terminal processing protease